MASEHKMGYNLFRSDEPERFGWHRWNAPRSIRWSSGARLQDRTAEMNP